MKKCIIFDLDGTLVDSEPLCNKAFKDLLPTLSLSVVELMARFRGKRLSQIFGEIEGLIGYSLPVDFEDIYRAQVEKNFTSSLEAFPGVRAALSSLDFSICIASNGPQAKIRSALSKTRLAEFFEDRVFSSYDVGYWKPHPGLFLHAAESMGVLPDMCIVVEDSSVGISAAQSAGMVPLHFCHSVQPIDGVHSFSSYSDLGQKIRDLS